MVAASGCSSDPNNTAISFAPATADAVNTSDQAEWFEYFDGSRYLSESLGDAGIGEDGPVTARFPINFGRGILDWSVSRLLRSSSYEFLDADSMIVSLENAAFEVPIDTVGNTYVWMGEIYTHQQYY